MDYKSDNYSICAQCLAWLDLPPEKACQCGEWHRITHPELESLAIAHLDCDAFYASVEKRDHPELANRPVIVGGGQRGVVATCCYIARAYGVRSAMPMFKARTACPDAVIIKPDMGKYVQISKQIRSMMDCLTPMVEPLSIDEAFMDLSGTEQLHGMPPALTLANLQRRIEDEIGISVSIGLSHNKFLAKIASDHDKPKGFFVIGRAQTQDFLAGLPVGKIWGVGRVTQKRLADDGITTIAHLQQLDENVLMKRYGEIGLRLARLSYGRDIRPVKTHRTVKSISHETTFQEDIRDVDILEKRLWELCEKVSKRLKHANTQGRVITLKLKNADFTTQTKRVTLTTPTNFAHTAFAAARPLLHELAIGTPFRLIGVGLSDLSPCNTIQQGDMFDAEAARIGDQESAVDAIREKFGPDAIQLGRVFKHTGKRSGKRAAKHSFPSTSTRNFDG